MHAKPARSGRRRSPLTPLIALASLVLFTGASLAQPTKPAPSAEGGLVRGKVAWKGKVPKNRSIRMGSDPYCEKCQRAEGGTPRREDTIVNENGTLRNAVVWVAEGLPERAWPVRGPALVLDQIHCRYVPHVLGIQLGQKLTIKSSDATSHNVHFKSNLNGEWNLTMSGPGTIAPKKPFKRPEIGARFVCDQHPWMSAQVAIFDHPFFAVTGEDGRFELKGLPAGTYRLKAWHEKHGEREVSVTVGEKPAEATFTFERKPRRRRR